jgi:hypothetical protein
VFLFLFVPLDFANRISGFDHLDLDKKQENWHENMFPYKLGGYRKRLLTKPIGRRTSDEVFICYVDPFFMSSVFDSMTR